MLLIQKLTQYQNIVNTFNAEEKYKKIFYDRHIGNHSGLKMSNIQIQYRVFKCNTALTNNQKVESHYRRVHLLPKGCSSLKKREIIAVNATLEFKINDLTEFEYLGPSKQTALLDSVYTHVIARGVFEAGSSRNGASLQRSRSSQFLLGMKNSCSSHYFDRFKFALRNTINKDVDDDFVCTWQHVETAMFQAIGKENRVNRLHSFNKIKPSDFHSKPLEMLIADVDGKIDASLGKSLLFHKDTNGRLLSYYSYSIFHKYNIILGITEHLGSEFNQVKDYIEQEISNMFEDLKNVLDMKDFIAKLVTEFESKNLIKLFRTKSVPKRLKESNINQSDIKEENKKVPFRDSLGPVKAEFNKLKVTPSKDLETAKELAG